MDNTGTVGDVDAEMGISRDEVSALMVGLMRIDEKVSLILEALIGDEDGEEEEDPS